MNVSISVPAAFVGVYKLPDGCLIADEQVTAFPLCVVTLTFIV